MNLVGTTNADEITVQRVTNTQDNINDGEYDFIIHYDKDGNLITSPNSFDPEINALQLAQIQQNIAQHQEELEQAIAGGNTQRIADAQERVDLDHELIEKHDLLLQKLAAGKFVRYTLAGVYDCYIEVPEQLSSSAKITIDAGAGADKVTIGTSVPMKASIFGGSGADTLTSGKKAVQMFGGGGSDRLISRSTKGGTLDGGTGVDRYYNRGGAELTIAVRKDGDQIITTTGTLAVTKPGVFGTVRIESRAYYLVSNASSKLDLLA